MYPLIARFVIKDVGLELEDLITHAVELFNLPRLLEVVEGFVEGTRNMLHGARPHLKLSAAIDAEKQMPRAKLAISCPPSAYFSFLPARQAGVPAQTSKAVEFYCNRQPSSRQFGRSVVCCGR